MNPAATRVVYDCNVLLGAMLSTKGAAFKCKRLVDEERVTLFLSPFILQELRQTPHHPDLRKFAAHTPQRVEAFIRDLLIHATMMDQVPSLFDYPRDPDDAHYVNLALAVKAIFVVSNDNDLLDLMDVTRPEGIDFKRRFPDLRIVEPMALVREIEHTNAT